MESYRWCELDFQKLFDQYGDAMIYVGAEVDQYEHFKTMTGLLQIKHHKVENFYDLCVVVSSCKLFVGSPSAPLTIAHAAHVDRICGRSGFIGDNNLNGGLQEIWDNIRYDV
jgi:hypothetical protein